jgi:hypothetical protein
MAATKWRRLLTRGQPLALRDELCLGDTVRKSFDVLRSDAIYRVASFRLVERLAARITTGRLFLSGRVYNLTAHLP